MTTLDQPTIYDETLYGEPVELPVRPPALNTDHTLWLVGDRRWVVLPEPVAVHRAPDVGHMITEIRQWTGWSTRQLAIVLGTSHTTVRNAEGGRPLLDFRSGDLRRRVTAAHDLIGRVFLLADRDAQTTSDLLRRARRGRASPIDAFRAGNPERAYLAAIDALRPRQTGMLVGDRPRRAGATAPLHE